MLAKCRWIGHTLRKPEGNIAKEVPEWHPLISNIFSLSVIFSPTLLLYGVSIGKHLYTHLHTYLNLWLIENSNKKQ